MISETGKMDSEHFYQTLILVSQVQYSQKQKMQCNIDRVTVIARNLEMLAGFWGVVPQCYSESDLAEMKMPMMNTMKF